MVSHSRPLLIVAAFAVFAFPGCIGDVWEQAQNAAVRKQTFNELKQYSQAWFAHHDTHNRGPNDWQELNRFAPAGLQQTLEGKGYQFVWGASVQEMKVGTSNTIMAYPSDAATSGGLVSMADGSVQLFTAEEFNQKFAAQDVGHKGTNPSAAAANSAASSPSGNNAPPGPPAPASGAAAAKQAEAARPLPTFQRGDKAYFQGRSGWRHVEVVEVLPDNKYLVQEVGSSGSVKWIVAASSLAVSPPADASPTTGAAAPQPVSSAPATPPANEPSSPAPAPAATTTSAGVPTARGAFERGQKVFAEWAGKWEPVEILDVLPGDKYKIRWSNWGPQWDEVREGTRLAASPPAGSASPGVRPSGGIPEPPPPGGGDAPGTAITADTPLAAGDKVYAFWLGKWVPTEVVGVRGGHLVTVRVSSPASGAAGPETTLPRNWVRLMAAAPTKTAESKPTTATAERRTWTDSSGKFKIEARFISFAEGQVTLEKADGVQIRMPLEKLSAADRKFVTEQALRP